MNIFDSISEYFSRPPQLWQSMLVSVFLSILSYVLGIMTGWYKKNLFFFRRVLRLIWNVLPHKKYVLIWNDHALDTSATIASILKNRVPEYRYRVLSEPDKLISYPLDPKYVHSIILIVSDVTKLAEVESLRNLIQKKLLFYVRKGGTLFGTHDLIYRRCRNETLQAAYGCELINFQRIQGPIEVELTEGQKSHPLLSNLPLRFSITDGELCWGDWRGEPKVLIQTKLLYKNNFDDRELHVPILVIRHTGEKGTLIWFNSADKFDEIAKSLNEPEEYVMKIFENSIRYLDQIKKHDNPVFYASQIQNPVPS